MVKAELYADDPLRRWLNVASARLSRAGVNAPRHDAERIAAHVLGVRWGDLWIRPNRVLPRAVLVRLDSALVRRESGEPLAYIEGTRGFYGLELACGPGVLVPRPETEVLVDVALELIEGKREPTVVDIGTGTGSIALAVATRRPDAEVFATDLSDEALEYARENASALDVDVLFAYGDLFEAVPVELRGHLDLIVSNPPYVPQGAGLAADVRAEPPMAIFGGGDGCDVLRRIVGEAPRWLRPGGALAFEIGEPYQADVLEGAQIRDDLTGRPRVAWARF